MNQANYTTSIFGKMNIRDYILWFMAATYPLIVIPNPVSYSTLPRFIILFILSILALYSLIREKVNIKHPVLMPLGIFLVFTVISTILAYDPFFALIGSPKRFTGLITHGCCIVLFMAALTSDKKKKLLIPMLICTAVVSLIALLQYFGIHLEPKHPVITFPDRGHGTIGNPNFLGTYTAFFLMGSILFYLQYPKWQWLACTGLIYAGLLVCLTRGAWLAAFVSFILLGIYALRTPEKRKQFGVVVVTFIIITALLLPVHDGRLYKKIFSIQNEVESAVQLEDKAGTGRIFIWKETIKLIPDYWAFGIGPDNLMYAEIITPTDKLADKAHNIYLEMAVTLGIFALLAYLAFLVHVFKYWYLEGKNFIFFMMIFTYLLQGFFNINVVPVLPLFWIILGLALKKPQEKGTC